jgi:hypothetical protein
VLVLSALIHLLVYGALVADLTHPGGRFFLFIIAVPVLALHLAVWASARFLALAWALVVAFILNVAWTGAGWLFWTLKPGEAAMMSEQAATRAMLFFAIGLAASALLIAWVRFVSRRKSAST